MHDFSEKTGISLDIFALFAIMYLLFRSQGSICMTRKTATVIFVVFIVFALYFFRILIFLPTFLRLRKYLKSEIRRAATPQDRKYWKREKRKLYCCFLPFITLNNIDAIFRFFRRKE